MSLASMPRMPFSKEQLEQPSPEITSLLQCLIPDNYEGENRRCEPRVPLTLAIPAFILDGYGRPLDTQFTILTRNISTKGICLLHTEELDAEYLALELPDNEGHTTQVLMEILHTRKIQQAYEMGGKFVSKLL